MGALSASNSPSVLSKQALRAHASRAGWIRTKCNIHFIVLGFVFKTEERVKMQRNRVQNEHDWEVHVPTIYGKFHKFTVVAVNSVPLLVIRFTKFC